MTPEERRAYRAERRRQREIAALKKRIAAACAAFTIMAGGGACIANVVNQNATKEVQTSAISDIYMDSRYHDKDDYSEYRYIQDDLDEEISTEENIIKNKAIQSSAVDKVVDAANIDGQKIERINEILDNNPDIRKCF